MSAKRRTRPPEGYEWEQPGFTWQIDWPPNFVMPEHKAAPRFDPRETAAKGRQTALSRGITGTIVNLSGNPQYKRGDPTKGIVSKKGAKA